MEMIRRLGELPPLRITSVEFEDDHQGTVVPRMTRPLLGASAVGLPPPLALASPPPAAEEDCVFGFAPPNETILLVVGDGAELAELLAIEDSVTDAAARETEEEEEEEEEEATPTPHTTPPLPVGAGALPAPTGEALGPIVTLNSLFMSSFILFSIATSVL
jgi:hypothetical protein